MDPREFFYFLWRWRGSFALMVLLGFFVGLFYTLNYEKEERGVLIFVTLGMQVSEGTPADYYVTNESHNVVDQFTETVQGWLFNPALLERVNEAADLSLDLSVRKQEKQNLLITVSTADLNVSEQVLSDAVLMVLNEEIQSYNDATQTSFVVALSSVTPFSNPPQHILNVLVATVLAAIASILLLLSWDYFRRRPSFSFQVESLLGQPAQARWYGNCSSNRIKEWVKDNDSWLPAHTQIVFDESDLKSLNKDHPIVAVVRLSVTPEDFVYILARRASDSFYYLLVA